ncbi:MAG: hypothetical protein JJE13_13090 [Thermoleophilia bacterium]|nr:hypothetical protein [Thermoleophilia bacterium]
MRKKLLLACVIAGLALVAGCGDNSEGSNDSGEVAAPPNSLDKDTPVVVGSHGPGRVRVALMALDCRNPPNTLACDRIWVQVQTAKKKERVSAEILRWSAKASTGWVYVYSTPKDRRLSTLRTAEAVNGPRWAQRLWTGTIRNAGIGSLQKPLEGKLPEGAERWVGNNPKIRADLIVTTRGPKGPTYSKRFRNVTFIAGHG